MVIPSLDGFGFVPHFFQFLFLDRFFVSLDLNFVLNLRLNTFLLFFIDFKLQNKAEANLPKSALTAASESGSFPPV